jgi:WD repeat-containing protein 45
VVLENRVYVYNFADLRLIDAIDTCNNPKGLCALNPDGKDTAILATPASQKGYVRIAFYSPQNTNNVFKAHDTAIEAIVLSKTGDFLATASETGTIIRFFSTKQTGGTVQPFVPFFEVRRGTTNANIHSLVFDNLDVPQFLACSSDQQTIHIFVVEHKDMKDQKKNPTGNVMFKMFGNNEARSYAKFILSQANSNAKCGFSEDGQTLVVITQAGVYYEAEIPQEGGTMKPKIQHDLLNNLKSAPNQGQGQGGAM